uniref:Uncharacterized protein n=1 Tax=Human herpesvirus 2 TaxID=10310 RepID=A0A481TX34_HHV2|nr:hypothetical protein [Human alphaherpesvirus 2]
MGREGIVRVRRIRYLIIARRAAVGLEIANITLGAVTPGVQTGQLAHGLGGGFKTRLDLPDCVSQAHVPGSARDLQQAAPRARPQAGPAVAHEVAVSHQVAQAVGAAGRVRGGTQDPKELVDALAYVMQIKRPGGSAPHLGLASRAPRCGCAIPGRLGRGLGLRRADRSVVSPHLGENHTRAPVGGAR